ncbi:MAG: SRPBCC family protein [Thermodesulfobacteriota bacterium]
MATVSVKVALQAKGPEVWEVISDFGGIARWVPGISQVSVAGRGVGAVRTVAYEDGTRSVERLESLNDDSRSLTYAILESTLPVQGYIGSLTVREVPLGSEVEWYSTFGAKGAAEDEVSRLLEKRCRQALAGLQKYLRR